MIRHIVMFRIKREVNEFTVLQNAEEAKKQLLALTSIIDCIKRMEVGINSDEADDNNYDVSLTCDFDTMEDLTYYQTHEEHVKVAKFIASIRESRACVDYEI